MQMVGFILFMFIILIIGFCAGYFVRAKNEVSKLDPHEKRLTTHYLTEAAEGDRISSDALREAGFEGPSVLNRAADLEALVKKIKRL